MPIYSSANVPAACAKRRWITSIRIVRTSVPALTGWWRDQRILVVAVLLYAASGYLAEALFVPGMMHGLWSYRTSLFAAVLTLQAVIVGLAWQRLRVREADRYVPGLRGWQLAWRHSRSGFLATNRLVTLATSMVMFMVFLQIFRDWKTAIPELHPFAWDPLLAAADQQLHGRAPWQLLMPYFGVPQVTITIDLLYFLWLPALVSVMLWLSWARGSRFRDRCILAFATTWIGLGTVLATMFSSVGPIFWGRLFPSADNPFGALQDYLVTVNQVDGLFMMKAQTLLWLRYEAGIVGVGSGIAAFPSIHVAMPVLYGCMAHAAGRKYVAAGCAVFTVITLVGSVHLGWHYAVDGYASIVLVPVIWRLSGRLDLRARDRDTET